MSSTDQSLENVSRVVEHLRQARRVLFITGAGLSAESGLPTYRGVGGLYERDLTDEGIPIEVALSDQMMARRPDVCWKYIAEIERACRGARPNRAHETIAALQTRFDRAVVLTQNVDGFHRDVGTTDLIEIHGNIHHLSCTRCAWAIEVPDFSGLTVPPACDECGSLVRPDVVLFGEMLPDAPVAHLQREVRAGFDAVLTIGTTSVFPYIAQPVALARVQGALTVEINPGDTAVSHIVDIRLRTGAVAALDAIVAALGRDR